MNNKTHLEILERMATAFLPSNLEIVLFDLTPTFIKASVEGMWPSTQSTRSLGVMLDSFFPTCEFNCPHYHIW